jgi:hypothetical protein
MKRKDRTNAQGGRKSGRLAPRKSKAGKSRPPRTAAEYFGRPQAFQERWHRAVGVISRMRTEGATLTKASRDAGISPRAVLRLAGSSVRKHSNGRYAAKSSDRLLRILRVPDADGTREVAVKGSRQASLLGEYWAGLQHYLQTGNASRLERFKDKSIKTADGTVIPLLTDKVELNRLGSAGVLSFESIYRSA